MTGSAGWILAEWRYLQVLAETELAAGQMRCIEADGHAVLVCRTRDGWHAVDNVCTHAYARLDEGRLRGYRLICPLHGASFDVRTGDVLGAPATRPLRSFPVRVREGRVEVQVANPTTGD